MIKSSSIAQKVFPGLAPDVQVIEQQNGYRTGIKVAAYCRVSTNHEDQEQSLKTQMAAFRKTISEHPGWVLAGIYADKGISGTSVKHREEFLRMINDAKAGKIQYILVKSISRFARNTVDALSYVRELKNCGVSVFFDREKLDTGNSVSEFLLSILAASAQEEIVSLSNNLKVARRMGYAAGIPQWTNIYGYKKDNNNEWVIDEEKAGVIRRLFKEYVEGKSLSEICRDLEKDEIPAFGGKEKWYSTSVSIVLHNEKYTGDILMQKTFISDPINHLKVSNRDAKIRQYYRENHHPPIVDKETFRMAAVIAAMKDLHRGTSQYPYYGFLKCPICGENMVRFAHSRDNRTFAWTCGGKANEKEYFRRNRSSCPPYYIIEDYIGNAFYDALDSASEEVLQEIAQGRNNLKSSAAESMLKLRRDNRNKKIEYKMLFELVEQITFPQWSVMSVSWKAGITTTARLHYRKVSDEPYPLITREKVLYTTKQKKQVVTEAYVVNGIPLFKGCPTKQIQGIRHAQSEVLDLMILEPKVYEPSVPRVYDKKKIERMNENAESAAANKV